jgi:hypothetical protein
LTTPKVFRHLFSDQGILAGFPLSAVKVLQTATNLKFDDRAYESDLQIFNAMVRDLRGALKSNVQMMKTASKAFEETGKLATQVISTNAPALPPEQSGDASPAKGSRRGRRRP